MFVAPKQNHRSPRQSQQSESQGSVNELTEVAAPSLVQEDDDGGHWRRDEHLERGLDATLNQEGDRQPSIKEKKPPQSALWTQLYIHSYLIFFSFFGTLARVGIQWLTFYPGAPVVISNLWANFGGCLIMGFFSEDNKIFRPHHENYHDRNQEINGHDKVELAQAESLTASMKATHMKLKKTIPIYIGLTTGFCGCFTSFSTFSRDMFFALANDISTPLNHPNDNSSTSATRDRNRGYSLLALLAVIILTLTVNTAALRFGAHLAIFLDRYIPSLPPALFRRFLNPLVTILAPIAWIGSIIACVYPPGGSIRRGQIFFALPFSPIGCLLRYYLSMKLNSLVDWFPMGTFSANVFGVAILSMAYALQHAQLLPTGLPGNGVIGCQVLQGIEDGFCGCLTTVSTWVLELCTLRKKHAYIYGGASVGVALCIVVLILGSVQWTVGFVGAACSIVAS